MVFEEQFWSNCNTQSFLYHTCKGVTVLHFETDIRLNIGLQKNFIDMNSVYAFRHDKGFILEISHVDDLFMMKAVSLRKSDNHSIMN
ncbi:hypothetical protein D3C72_1748330 [compost metagenome]